MDIMNYSYRLEVKEKFLSKKDFKLITDIIFSSRFPWLYNSSVAGVSSDNHGYYIHHIGTDHEPTNTSQYSFMNPIYDKLGIDVLVDTIYRLRAMHYPKTHTLVKHSLHQDHDHSAKTMLLFLNTCDGYTYFKEQDKKVYSTENTAVIFDSFNWHHSTTTTNTNRRLCLQVSWKG